jgi:ABC-type transport system involved in cytochrome bd biosynthesis fused ATPase/permease subunit
MIWGLQHMACSWPTARSVAAAAIGTVILASIVDVADAVVVVLLLLLLVVVVVMVLLLLLLQGKASFKQLDNQLARLAVKLPQGDLAGQARKLAAVQGGRDPNKTEEQQEEEELL